MRNNRGYKFNKILSNLENKDETKLPDSYKELVGLIRRGDNIQTISEKMGVRVGDLRLRMSLLRNNVDVLLK